MDTIGPAGCRRLCDTAIATGVARTLVAGDRGLAELVLRCLYRGTRADVAPRLDAGDVRRLASFTLALSFELNESVPERGPGTRRLSDLEAMELELAYRPPQ